jgi:hypothetical protein
LTTVCGNERPFLAQALKEGNPAFEFMSLQNASGHGIDLVGFNPTTNEVVHFQVKSSWANREQSVGNMQNDWNRWLTEGVNGTINNQPITTKEIVFLNNINNAIQRSGQPVKHYNAQVFVGRPGVAFNAQLRIKRW